MIYQDRVEINLLRLFAQT